MRPCAQALAIAALMLAWPNLAIAQRPPPSGAHGPPAAAHALGAAPGQPSAADKETARHLVHAGNRHFEGGEYTAALRAYQNADAIMHVPTTGLGVARALEALNRLVEARDVALRVAATPSTNDESQYFVAARDEAAHMAEAVRLRIPSLVVTARRRLRG